MLETVIAINSNGPDSEVKWKVSTIITISLTSTRLVGAEIILTEKF
jgi:hypothetical protein